MSIIFFFFSSRRRHTRSLRDWSSDVCSSDLVASATFSRFGMLSGGRWIRVAMHFSEDKGEKEIKVNCNPVAPRFLETMGIPIILGRDFAAADEQRAPRVAVVSESFARKYFPGEVALGKQLLFKD